MPELTIVVPLLHDIEAFEATLASVLRFSHRDIQIVGLHDGDYEDQYGIGDEVELIPVSTNSLQNRSFSVFSQLAYALDDFRSSWLHWITPGIEPLGECYDQVLEVIKNSRDVGCISPQILPSVGADEADVDDLECLASAVIATKGYHPQYLEEVVGDCWTLDDIGPEVNVAGPTCWAGFCSKNLFRMWVQESSKNLRLSDGYRELAFGLYLQQEGWKHEIVPCSLVASESTEEKIREGWSRNGSQAVELFAAYQTGSAVSKLLKNVGCSVSELFQSVVAPSNFLPAVTRLCSSGQLMQSKPKRRLGGSRIGNQEDLLVPMQFESQKTDQDWKDRKAA